MHWSSRHRAAALVLAGAALLGSAAPVAAVSPTVDTWTAHVDAQAVSFAGDHAWLTVSSRGVLEVDLKTNQVRRTIPLLPSPLVPLDSDGRLWVNDFDRSALWRIDL